MAHIMFLCLAGLIGSASGIVLSRSQQVDAHGKGCAALTNHGSHFTVAVGVGTPSQGFDVVADTGSNTLIVPSCLCQANGHCPASDPCFTGTNRSSTFALQVDAKTGQPGSMILSYGSGDVVGVIAKDDVTVGGVTAMMDEGLMLMTDRRLSISGTFEGILGLGVPQTFKPPSPGAGLAMKKGGTVNDVEHSGLQQIIDEVIGSLAGRDEKEMVKIIKNIIAERAAAAFGGKEPKHRIADVNTDKIVAAIRSAKFDYEASQHSPEGFIQQSGIGKFSMCFNSGGNGVLRIGPDFPPEAIAHGSLGTAHWGVGLAGVSIDNKTSGIPTKMAFCTGDHMQPGQVSPCGAIPDSGTTLFMGPEDQVLSLFDGLCDSWERCRTAYAQRQGQVTKADMLQMLLIQCEDFLGEESYSDFMAELPDLHFNIVGTSSAGQTSQAIRITPRSYVMEVPAQNSQRAPRMLADVDELFARMDAGSAKESLKGRNKVCQPSFGAMNYNTRANGPVWIMGMGLFYDHVVAYDMLTSPPTLTFTEQKTMPCGSCSGTNLMITGAGVSTMVRNRPMRVEGGPRMPSYDVSDGL